jgi:CHAD domain-containing protein
MALDRKQLQKPMRKLRKLVNNFSKQPSQEDVHDLRTNTRRLEALLQALQLDSRGNEKRLLQAVTPVRRRAGKVRDADVLTGFASTLHAGEEAECRTALLEYLGHRRYRHAAKLGKQVQSGRKEIRSRLKRCSAHVNKLLGNPKQGAVGGQASAEVAALSLRLAAELAEPPRLNAGNLHEYRKKVKELRYVLQFAEHSDADLVDTLGEVKDAIGEWHDFLELGAMARKVLDHGSDCGLLQEIRGIESDKFSHALNLTNQMRAKYVTPKPKRRGRQPSGIQLTKPVLTATSALAA